MKIDKIKLENFRCFENLEVNFEKCHALVGENGSGKTTILEAINFATSGGYKRIGTCQKGTHLQRNWSVPK